jgi:putative tryptophan/tyrosine transport system substrate-binding protein
LGKRFELLKEMLPNLSRVGILFNPDVAATRDRLTTILEIAPTLGLTTIPVEARGLHALEQAFTIMVQERVQAVVMQGDSALFNLRSQIADMAMRNRLPAVSTQKELAEAGFLLWGRYRRSLPSVRRFC